MTAGRAPGRSQAGPTPPPEAAGARAVQAGAGRLGAAALSPLGGSVAVRRERGADTAWIGIAGFAIVAFTFVYASVLAGLLGRK